MQANSPLETLFTRITPGQAGALKKLGIRTIRDLLYHFPARYIGAGADYRIQDAPEGVRVSVYGKVTRTETKRSFRGRVPMAEVTIMDATGTLKLIWFHQPYIAKMLQVGNVVRASGILSRKQGGAAIMNPEIEKIPEMPEGIGSSLFADTTKRSGASQEQTALYPVYPESRGITSRWFFHAIERVFAKGVLDTMEDPIPEEILKHYHLPSLRSALIWMHTPRNEKHVRSAQKRFAFEEVFLIQLTLGQARLHYASNPSFRIPRDEKGDRAFITRLGFPLTKAQERAIEVIESDMNAERPMLRLLEGDVGSGKTAVAATTAASVVGSRPGGKEFGNLQVAYMCPTEILATQHFESFIRFFIGSDISIGLITGSGCKKFPSKVDPAGWTNISRAQLLKWVANGEIPILIGTHALIQKSVAFKHLAYVIIDEQHRFGTTQRAQLARKDTRVPHVLSMTATPIPRTLALTIYGDLDLTLLDEMPRGRKPVITEIIPSAKRDATYEKIRIELRVGRQVYVICPRIDEPDPEKEAALQAKSVTEEAKQLKEKIFPEYTIEILHSKMTPKEKDAVMERFASGRTHILVATSVVEVGVNVPNATVIVIEGAERFGLAQLHQLRGRVLRGEHQAYCFLFPETKGSKSLARLKALASAKNGFELAEMDLALRGAGELGGGKQWGITDIGMEAIKNVDMVEAAREEAKRLLATDPTLGSYPQLVEALHLREGGMHFE